MRAIAVLALVGACSKHAGGPVELAEQPVVTDGVREAFALDLEALPAAERPAALARAVRTVRMRLQLAEIAGRVAVDDRQQIVVDLATSDPEVFTRATELIARRGRLEIRVVVADAPRMAALAEHVGRDPAAKAVEIAAHRDQWTTEHGRFPKMFDWTLRAPDREELVDAARAKAMGCHNQRAENVFLCTVTGRKAIETYLAALDPSFALPDDHAVAFERERPRDVGDDRRSRWIGYYVSRTPALTGDAIVRAEVLPPDPELSSDLQAVRVELDEPGTAAFAALTEHHIGDRMAILLDGTIASAPILEGAIRGGAMTVARVGSADEARDLAIVLTSGALPSPILLEYRAKLIGGVVQPNPDH